MATTRLTDVIVPEVFYPYMVKRTMVKSAIRNSGMLRMDGEMARFLQGGGTTVNVPFWKDLSDTEAEISSDDPDSESVPEKIQTGKDIAVRHNRNKSWSTMDLTGDLAGDDPMKRIAERVSDWWIREEQRHLVSTLTGLLADNIANDSGDMVYDIGTDAAGTITAAERISGEAILDAAQTMGDASDALSTLIMHSVCYNNLAKLNLIDFIPDSEGRVRFASYLGYRVIVDDSCPAVAGSNRTEYTTYLLARDAIAFAEAPPATPVETFRYPAKGDGAGMETLYTRKQRVLHPYGIKWTSSSMAGLSPTNAEIELAANWDRVYPERKQIGIAALLTNG